MPYDQFEIMFSEKEQHNTAVSQHELCQVSSMDYNSFTHLLQESVYTNELTRKSGIKNKSFPHLDQLSEANTMCLYNDFFPLLFLHCHHEGS
jgi:hypothetical protein